MGREWNSGAYDRLSQPQLSWGKRVLERVRRLPLRGGERILDAGCGTGRVTAELFRELPASAKVVGVDLSQNQLRLARDKLEPDFPGRLMFVCADIGALPFTAAFDGIFSTAAFHWVKNHERLFLSLYRVLKPGGWLVAQCGGGPNLAHLRERAQTLQKSSRFSAFFAGWQEPWEFADAETAAQRLRDAGFIEIRTWLENANLALKDREEYREYLATVTLHEHLARIPDERNKEEFLDELARAASLDGCFAMDYWRLNIDAKKPTDR